MKKETINGIKRKIIDGRIWVSFDEYEISKAYETYLQTGNTKEIDKLKAEEILKNNAQKKE